MRSTWYHHPWLSRQCCAPSSQSIMPFPIHAAAGSMRCAAPRVSVGGSRPARTLLVQCLHPNTTKRRKAERNTAKRSPGAKGSPKAVAEELPAWAGSASGPASIRLVDLEGIFDWKVRQGPGSGCVGDEHLCRGVLGVSWHHGAAA